MVDELSMVEVKKLLDVVSRLAFSDSSHAALQDELAIMVRKQLSHTDIKYESFFATMLLLWESVYGICVLYTFFYLASVLLLDTS